MELDMVADMEVDKVANMVVDMEVDMMANMVATNVFWAKVYPGLRIF